MNPLEKLLHGKHRVIVQLNKYTEKEESRSSKFHSPIKINKLDPFVEKDYTTLLINYDKNENKNEKQSQLNFDCVCSSFDSKARYEISLLADQLFLYQQNCCMIRCTIYRENSSNFLNIFLTEASKRLQNNYWTVKSIKCEFYDVRKLNVVSMFGNGILLKMFYSLMDLQKWINNDYQQLHRGCQGNDCLEFEFIYCDRTSKMMTVKFSYMNIVVSKLDSDSKEAFINCVTNINQQYVPRGNNTLLLDTLRDYLGDKKQMKMWLFIGLPVQRPITSLMDDMINIASAASKGFSLKALNSPSLTDINKSRKEQTKIPVAVKDTKNVSKAKDLKKGRKEKSKSKLTTTEKTESTTVQTITMATAGTKENLRNFTTRLYQWYDKINNQFTNTSGALKSYYCKKYEVGLNQLCTDIHNIVALDECDMNQLIRVNSRLQFSTARPVIIESMPSSELSLCRSKDLKKTTSNWGLHLLREYLAQYLRAASELGLMVDEVNKIKYEPLKVFMRKKRHELKRLELEYKLKKLQELQFEIQQTINEESQILLQNLRNIF